MNCPHCGSEENQREDIRGFDGKDNREKFYGAQYWCLNCQEYFFWGQGPKKQHTFKKKGAIYG